MQPIFIETRNDVCLQIRNVHVLKNHVQTLDVSITLIVLEARPRGRPANIHTYNIFLETRIISLHFAADSMGLASFTFFWWAP